MGGPLTTVEEKWTAIAEDVNKETPKEPNILCITWLVHHFPSSKSENVGSVRNRRQSDNEKASGLFSQITTVPSQAHLEDIKPWSLQLIWKMPSQSSRGTASRADGFKGEDHFWGVYIPVFQELQNSTSTFDCVCTHSLTHFWGVYTFDVGWVCRCCVLFLFLCCAGWVGAFWVWLLDY